MREILKTWLWIAAVICIGTTIEARRPPVVDKNGNKPNIIFIMSDDMVGLR